MGNCFRKKREDIYDLPAPIARRKTEFKPRPFVDESNEPFSLVYYNSLMYRKKSDFMRQNLCECNSLEEYFNMSHFYTMPEHACDMLVLVNGTLFRINNPGSYKCHKCGILTCANLFMDADIYKLYYEGKFIWSAIPSEIVGSALCLQFNIIEVPNFGCILYLPQNCMCDFIVYLPDVTVMLPKSMTNGEDLPKTASFGEAFEKASMTNGEDLPKTASFGEALPKTASFSKYLPEAPGQHNIESFHYVVNTLEAGAVGIFHKIGGVKAALYSEYIAINENGKQIKMQKLRSFRDYNRKPQIEYEENKIIYYCDYGKIDISKTGAEFIGTPTGKNTKVAVRIP
jgi:hypothetical protein